MKRLIGFIENSLNLIEVVDDDGRDGDDLSRACRHDGHQDQEDDDVLAGRPK